MSIARCCAAKRVSACASCSLESAAVALASCACSAGASELSDLGVGLLALGGCGGRLLIDAHLRFLV